MSDALNTVNGEPGQLAKSAVIKRKRELASAEQVLFELFARVPLHGLAVDRAPALLISRLVSWGIVD
ncbi:hypothetical protein BB170200_02351 [Mycobacterium marinum]|nr:hypothetical protein BB170200_02351 [Mycobacterium marinum]